MRKRDVPDWVTGLPTNVWSDIFRLLASGPQDGVSLSPACKLGSHLRSQAQYYELRLVCRRFRAIFQQDSQLSGCVILPPGFDDQSFISLQLWLKQHGSAVRFLVASLPGVHLDKAMQSFSTSSPGLSHAQILGCSHTTVQLLSTFRSLTTCELKAPSENQDLNIDALQSLDKLQALALMNGYFHAAQLPFPLTSLRLEHADVEVAYSCKCATSLLKLSLLRSQLRNFHEQGLFACLSLETLCCCPGLIDAQEESLMFSVDLRHFVGFPPMANLSTLSRLSSLKLDFGRMPDWGPIDLSPLYVLTSLESLELRCRLGDSPVEFGPGFAALTRLRQLDLCARSDMAYSGDLVLDLPWDGMLALQSVVLSAYTLCCDKRLLGLSKLMSLLRVELRDCVPGNDETRETVLALEDLIEQGCLNVQMVFHSLYHDQYHDNDASGSDSDASGSDSDASGSDNDASGSENVVSYSNESDSHSSQDD